MFTFLLKVKMKKFKQLRSEKHLISTDWENFVRKSEDISTSAVDRKDSLLLGARGQFFAL